MEDGKRMFSIFAARMFEQRVLTAYRERVAQERQLQLLRELEDEDRVAHEREAKKAKENQKKKDKKRWVGGRDFRNWVGSRVVSWGGSVVLCEPGLVGLFGEWGGRG
ncbi:hypothetical protein BDV93DRAFT_524212 [Ceratobasidium sp. AG-I]|nr:hypothetical protein BDV93DRAFT_524212 [Ceratobasidium sp. AG-I]